MAIWQPIWQPMWQPVWADPWGETAFDITSLFAAGEQGAWYDPSDLSTLYAQRTGTLTTQSTVGSVVGTMLDKSGRNNHAAAPSDAARPLLGREPEGGVRNRLISTDALATQSRTVTAVAHTLSFTGTGTVTLSGASTAGPLVGTGASDRVSLTFTPSDASLTLTVSGTVTLAQLEIGSTAKVYQKVGASSLDVTEAGKRDLYYLKFDGSDDGLRSGKADSPWPTFSAAAAFSAVPQSDKVIFATGRNDNSTTSAYAPIKIAFGTSGDSLNLFIRNDTNSFTINNNDGVIATGKNETVVSVDETGVVSRKVSGTALGGFSYMQIGTLKSDFLTVGYWSRGTTIGQYLDGNIFAVIGSDGAWEAKEKKMVEKYLAQKSGVDLT
jgi:hypothetical protein